MISVPLPIIISFLAPYLVGTKWKFELAACLILMFSRFYWKENWIEHIGLKFKKRDFVLSVLLILFIYLGGGQLITHLINKENVLYYPHSDWPWRIAPIFQALNEEIVLRALLLRGLTKLLSIIPS